MSTTSKLTKDDALAIVHKDAYCFSLLPDEFRSDKDVVLAAVIKDGYLLECASEDLQNDKAIVIAAVTQNGYALQHVNKYLQNDKDVVIAAVTQNGYAFEHVNTYLRNDKDVVIAAVTQNGYFGLLYASAELKNDKNIVLAAVNQDGRALELASTRLQKDHIIIFVAAHRKFISDADWPVVKRALLEKPDYFLNPEPYMQALTEGMNSPYLMLAQYALNKDLVIEPTDYPDCLF